MQFFHMNPNIITIFLKWKGILFLKNSAAVCFSDKIPIVENETGGAVMDAGITFFCKFSGRKSQTPKKILKEFQSHLISTVGIRILHRLQQNSDGIPIEFFQQMSGQRFDSLSLDKV